GLLAGGAHHHSFGDRGVAGDLQLGGLLDLDQAHPAVAVHRQVGVPAEVRDLDAELQRSLDHRGSGSDLDLSTVDGALGHGLSVELPGDDVEAADDRHRVGQQVALDHFRKGLVDVEAGGPDLHQPGE